ncbi:T9SS type B sorting domain-containing protein [uncultured Winogradskyella sp.]|uniref:T9SS type B sorting domain-containing protein n=1 Tax=uncultured Winogradskyella sp. TaxID=395353 RepID=UPI002628F9EB|nr:T9SS type B sorting domain-containing protein [uncultured Winogradskyella sp.]
MFLGTFAYGQCPSSDVTLNSQAAVTDFITNYPNCDTISGDLIITGNVTDISGLDNITSIDGKLVINNTQLTSVEDFNNLAYVLYSIEITNNDFITEIDGFNGLIDLGALFIVENNASLEALTGFNEATAVFGDFWINYNPLLETISGFDILTTAYGFFGITNCPILSSIPSFNNLNYVSWGIQFNNVGLTDIADFDNLTAIGGVDAASGFIVSNNQNLISVSGFNCLDTITFDFLIQDNPVLENIYGLSSLSSVGQFFTIRNNASLASLNGLQNLSTVSSTGYENTVVFQIFNNSQLSDCDSLCNILSSDGIIGLTNISANATGCDSESVINTTDCEAFQGLSCTMLSMPLFEQVNVAIDTDISWNAIDNATSYLVTIGTSSQGTQIIDNLNVGNITTYDLPNDLPENTEIFVKIKAFNGIIESKCCAEESFTTEIVIPECTTLSSPINGEENVSVTADISWNSVEYATGYLVSVGTSSGGTDLINNYNVGNTTTYSSDVDFPINAVLYVTITPYSSGGNSTNCIEESFTTQMARIDCSNLLNPVDGADNVEVTTDISWSTSNSATGYILNIGITEEGTEIINNLDVGNVTSYNFLETLPSDTEIFVTIIPYNSYGQSMDCETESFKTELVSLVIPKFFTPNDDQHNNFWIVEDPFNEIERVTIFNRYGKLIKTLYAQSLPLGWNGNFKNNLMPTNDYWYKIELKNGKELNGHFTLKR